MSPRREAQRGFASGPAQSDFATPPAESNGSKVLERITAAKCPESEAAPARKKDVQALSAWISGRVQAGEAAARAARDAWSCGDSIAMKYENTVSDLLGVKVNVREQLPQDGSANGFDNAGFALHSLPS